MAALRLRLVSILLATVVVATSGCAVRKPIRPIADPTRAPYSRIKPGDYVMLQLHDGTRAEFVVQTVDGDGIAAVDGARYPNADIRKAHVRVMTRREAIVVTALIAGGAFLVLVALAYGSAFDGMM